MVRPARSSRTRGTGTPKSMSPGGLVRVIMRLTRTRNEATMLRKTFETELRQVKDEVLVLGSMTEQAILNSVEALKKRDLKAAQKLLEADRDINKKRFEIEHTLMILIATQQPMAHDLRLLASTLEIISELERMGDYAKGISNINIR